MVDKVHGFSETGFEALTGNMDFFTVRTLVDISPLAVGNATTQAALDTLVETVAMRAAPVIASDVTSAAETGIIDLPASGGAATVFTFKFAVEHTEAWTTDLLSEALDATGLFVWTSPTTANNVAVTLSLTL